MQRSLFSCLALLASACGVFGLNDDERASLDQHKANASLYWSANRLPQALDQVRQGLEIDPSDYRLNTVKGYCLLRQAKDPRYATTPARKQAMLEDAQAAFDATLALRSFQEHGPQVLLGDALLHEEFARFMLDEKHLAEAEAARREITSQERALFQVRLQECDTEARTHLARSQRDLDVLIERGDMLRLAYKHMLSVKSLGDDYVGAVEAGQKYLEHAAAEQDAKQKVYESTMKVSTEEKVAQELSELVDDELTVRSQLANLHFDRGKYDMAIFELDRILQFDPSRSADYYNRARALYEAGRLDEAYRDVQKFLATHNLPAGHPSLVRAHDMLRQIEARR
ncbi:MAG: BTAD domain-containing putative transcriptional regulator [Planctomycetota bacterium]